MCTCISKCVPFLQPLHDKSRCVRYTRFTLMTNLTIVHPTLLLACYVTNHTLVLIVSTAFVHAPISDTLTQVGIHELHQRIQNGHTKSLACTRNGSMHVHTTLTTQHTYVHVHTTHRKHAHTHMHTHNTSHICICTHNTSHICKHTEVLTQ